jgi:hypothetical protein
MTTRAGASDTGVVVSGPVTGDTTTGSVDGVETGAGSGVTTGTAATFIGSIASTCFEVAAQLENPIKTIKIIANTDNNFFFSIDSSL